MTKKAYEKRALQLAKNHAKDLAKQILNKNTEQSNHFMAIYDDALEENIIAMIDKNV